MAIEFIDVLDAKNNTYDPTNSTLTDTRVQDAIDSLDAKIGGPVSLAMVNLDVTDSDVSASSGTHYNLTVSGMTAERNVILPEASIGDVIRLNLVSDAPAEYELVVKGDATVTINGGNVATEWSRLFNDNEVVELIATSGTNWDVVNDGRIHHPISVALTSAQTLTAATATLINFDNIIADEGNCFDTTNKRFTPRRTGTYLTMLGAMFATNASQKLYLSRVYKNAIASGVIEHLYVIQIPSTASTVGANAGGAIVISSLSDYYEFAVYSNDGGAEITLDSRLAITFIGD